MRVEEMKRWEEVNINNFSGPLDLLYTMVKERKISILDINLIELSNQYLNYISLQKELDIEVASEYLTMAAYLIELKSQMLLPREEILSDEDFSYDELVKRLSRYEQIKNAANYLNSRQDDYFQSYAPKKSRRKFENALSNDEEVHLDLSLETFVGIYKKALKRYKKGLQEEQEDFDSFDVDEFNTIETQVISPADISQIVLQRMQEQLLDEWSIFQILSPEMTSLTNLISVFLAILDLVKYQIITVRQNEDNDDVLIRFTQYALENPEALNGVEVEVYE